MASTPVAPPSALVAKLAKPTSAYKRRAWLAMAGLVIFVLLYFALAGWFGFTAWRMTLGSDPGAKHAFWGWAIGACAAFLAVFMVKAVFFVKHGGTDDSIEITSDHQPELFRFLHSLADKAGAPRPHKVFLSARVNAAVFYDLSVLNLFFPSKKNLEIGLGLVNALTLGEFRAVLAHEFGHFAQRAMAVGRWVYVAQQIAAQLVARRDKLDDFLGALSRFDVRVAWVGWLLSLVVWSIRSLVESAFQVVVLMQRALSREMEMNADLVAVSLTGSDALIHALHRLQAADDAWGRAMHFAMSEKACGRPPRDLFEIQTRVVGHMGQLLNDRHYGRVPAATGSTPKAHRVFKAELAQPPQMWLTHPLNHEREANAKRHFVHAPVDARDAWVLFTDVKALREQVTAKLLGADEAAAPGTAVDATTDGSVQTLNKQFEREYFGSRYRGIYFGRSLAAHSANPRALTEAVSTPMPADLDRLYPQSLVSDMERLRTLEKEVAQLRALHSGALRPSGNVIRHRGATVKRSQLGKVLSAVEADLAALEADLQAHDRRCRGLHRAVAQQLGQGWPVYLDGLVAALHYAEHTERNLRDLQGVLGNTVAVVTATRRVSTAGRTRLVNEANALQEALQRAFVHAGKVTLDEPLRARLGVPSWAGAIGELGLSGATKENIGEWLKAVDSWVDHAAHLALALRNHALEQLLLTESALAGHLWQGSPVEAAPAESRVPTGYDTLVAGNERKRQTRLDWWGRFQTADGLVPAGARLIVAGGIVAGVLGFGAVVGHATVTIYNGLSRPVMVTMGDAPAVRVEAHGTREQALAGNDAVKIVTRTLTGQLIEQFDSEAHGSFGEFVYNVAGASPMVEWTATYGNAAQRPERMLGTARFFANAADVRFEQPPTSVSTKGGGATRDVLSGMGNEGPLQQLGALDTDAERARLIATHARWDDLDTPYTGQWLTMAQTVPDAKTVLSQRLVDSPDHVLLLRLEQDAADEAGRAAVCERHRQRAAAAPANEGFAYVATRCLPDGAAKDEAFLAGHASRPQHGWFAYAAGYVEAERSHWPQALAAFDIARRRVPALADTAAIDSARIRRLIGEDDGPAMAELSQRSDGLRQLIALETGNGVEAPGYKAYSELARGKLEQALSLASTAPPAQRDRLVRLAAASDGATLALVAKALALPADSGLDTDTVWTSIALAARAGQDTRPAESTAHRAAPRHAAVVLAFIEELRRGRAPLEAAAAVDHLPPELRAQAYGAGLVMLGAKAPAAWRHAAKRVLFASERPYFS